MPHESDKGRVKWTKEEMTEYARGYTHDAKQAWIRKEDYDRVENTGSAGNAGGIKVQGMRK